MAAASGAAPRRLLLSSRSRVAAASAAAAAGIRRPAAVVGAARLFSTPGGGGSDAPGDDEERRPHVWGDIPTGPAGAGGLGLGMTTAVGGGGRQFFVSTAEDEEGEAGKQAREPVDFLAESKAFLDRVERGLADMQEVNDPFHIERDETELVVDLGPAKGKFTLQRDWTQNQLVLLSPVSGINKYEFHGGREQRWLSVTEDRHDLVGMLTRDLIRVCAGCPQI